MAQSKQKAPLWRRSHLIGVIIIALLLYAVIPQLSIFRSSWHLLSQPKASWVVLAVVMTSMTYLAAALTYYLLAFQRLRYASTLLTQLAAMFVNRLLPGGVGALGVNYIYLRRNHHTSVQAGSVVAVNDLVGIIGHILILALALIFSAGQSKALSSGFSQFRKEFLLVLAVVLVVLAAVALFEKKRLTKLRREIISELGRFRSRPGHLIMAVGSSMSLTAFNIACFACAALALNVHLSFVILALIFTLGVGAAAVVPTPGGLGGFEAGLVGGLVAYHIDDDRALAVALLYRLVSYWLPLVVGGLAFIGARRRHLLETTAGT